MIVNISAYRQLLNFTLTWKAMAVHAWFIQISATFRDFYVDLEFSAQILKQCFIFYFILSL